MISFPDGKDRKSKNSSENIFGHRFHKDQTFYEYLIEFLLIFVSSKNREHTEGKMQFHDTLDDMAYYAEPRMALKRFIFLDKAKKSKNLEVDVRAYNELVKLVTERIEDEDRDKRKQIVADIQDLYHGYAIIQRNRSWCAQALLPICPEVIFCEVMPKGNARKKLQFDTEDKKDIDCKFSFTNHNFLARGGEVYYFHLLEYLQEHPDKKEKLTGLLKNFLTQQKELSRMANWIQSVWEEEMHISHDDLYVRMAMGYIPKQVYAEIEENSVCELLNFLSCQMNYIKKIELFAYGVMLQVMRMMTVRVGSYLGKPKGAWIVDMRTTENSIVKKLAAQSYRQMENDFMTAINQEADILCDEGIIQEEDKIKCLTDGMKASFDIFKAKGKEMQCIIPVKGGNERFSLSENVIRFLVTALIEPNGKMSLKMFLDKLYLHYGLVIGPEEYKKEAEQEANSYDVSLANAFEANVDEFQNFLKKTGFLRELSDATSIVVNPYEPTEEGTSCNI